MYLRLVSFLSVVMLILVATPYLAGAESNESSIPKLDKEELEELNELMEELKNEVNVQLEKGEKKGSASGYFKGEKFTLEFEDKGTNINPTNSDFVSITPMALRTSSFSVKLHNSYGFNFTHVLNATWSYDSITTTIFEVSSDSDLSGPFYAKDHNTYSEKLTPSVHEVYSDGYFDTARYGLQYTTHFHVRVNGTGTYQVLKAEMR